ncbi:hypothetical protein [Paenibacillus sp. NPDC058071]|uniref:hypothetical protein n=1 Tax=Paenibacillus sp. NPDC058071 TaxID=3346326 RepID=UPI0036DE0F98
MTIIEIDRAIKEAWINNIRADYSNYFLLLEDSLKNAFYSHLRSRLSDTFLLENKIRIFTEMNNGYEERIDIAIVRINDIEEDHLANRVVEYLAVIELKYKAKYTTITPFLDDIQKMRRYLKRKGMQDCQYYLGFIHEEEYGLEETSWLTEREKNSWAAGKLTELSGFYNRGTCVFTVISYNNLNEDLNHTMVK